MKIKCPLNDYVDLLLVFGDYKKNASKKARLYSRHFPNLNFFYRVLDYIGLNRHVSLRTLENELDITLVSERFS